MPKAKDDTLPPLDRAKVFDVRTLLISIKGQISQIEGANYRLATEVFVDELLALLNEPGQDEGASGTLIH